jgi:hypothetical protein
MKVFDIVNVYLERVKRIEQQQKFVIYLLKEGDKKHIISATKELKQWEDKLEEFLGKEINIASTEIEKEWEENEWSIPEIEEE